MAIGWLIGGIVVGALLGDTDKSKREFYDLYRQVDYKLACFVGASSGGIGLLDKYLHSRYCRCDRHFANSLNRAWYYRNELSHNKNNWNSISDPDSEIVSVISFINKNIYDFRDIMKDAEYYVGIKRRRG